MCRLRAQFFIALGLTVTTGNFSISHEVCSITRHHVGSIWQYGESHVLLEESVYIFRLALLRMIDDNTYHNGHRYGATL